MKPGEKVKFLNDVGEGKILSVRKKTAWVLRDDGFEVNYPISQLVIIHEKKEKSSEKKEIQQPILKTKSAHIEKTAPAPKAKRINELEIDLHIEELMEKFEGLSNGQILEIQLRKAESILNRAMTERIRKVIFIHGVGTGKLKQELRNLLSKYEGIEFYDGSYKKYGWGATEVKVF